MTKEDMVVSCVGAIIGLTAVFSGGNAKALKEETVENKIEVAESKTPKAVKVKYYNATTLSDKELKELLRAVGFQGKELKMAWAIAKKESNGRPLAFNNNKNTGDHSFGIFQINMIGGLMDARIEKFELASVSDLFNPVVNAEIAYHMSKGGKDWSSWTQLNGSRIKEFLQKYPSI
jgi:hypothetical protein